ncbi:beige protein [Ceratobasidium sp. AG-Ba]|nr:beige protein [Ceratobasidium sp. AG-Ba]
MLRSLLTPLRTRFEEAVALRNEPQEPVPESPEDFERDARIETMRMVVQSINAVEDETARLDLLGEATRLMQVDANTKDVFREMDGFLVIMSVLSSSAFSTSDKPLLALDRALQIFSNATLDHPVNLCHFKHNVGYEALESSVSDYVNRKEQGVASSALSSLAAFAFQLPSLSSFLPSVDSTALNPQGDGPDSNDTNTHDYDPAGVDSLVTQQDTTSAQSTHSEAVTILLRLVWALPSPAGSRTSYAIAKLLDRLAAASHANRAALGHAGIVQLVWDRLYTVNKSSTPASIPLPESTALQKLIRRILELGAPLDDLKLLFRRTADPTVATKALALLKGNPNARWPSFLAFRGDGAGLDVKQVAGGGRGTFGSGGFTMLMWIYIEHRSPSPTHLFGFTSSDSRAGQYTVMALVLQPDGGLAVMPTFRKNSDAVDISSPVTLPGSMIQRGKWTHLGLTWAPAEAGIKMYVDGHLTDTITTIPYPQSSQITLYYGCSPIMPSTTPFAHPDTHHRGPVARPQHQRSQSSYIVDPSHPPPPPQFYLASTHLLTKALSAPLVRLAHHLGPRYNGTLRSGLGRYLSHEAATALNVYLSAAGNHSVDMATELVGGIENGVGDIVLCALHPAGWVVGTPATASSFPDENELAMGERRVLNAVAGKQQDEGAWADVRGDVRMFEIECVDEALRRVGGAAVGLGLVQRAENSEMLYESVCILINGVRTNWRLLEDMESLSGYEVLGQLLIEKAGMITLDLFNALFEHMGLDFKIPSKSVVTNIQAYRALALDLDLWSRSPMEVQQSYLSHFSILLTTSKFARFTVKSRFQSHKIPVVKRLLLAIQLGTFKDEMELRVVGALRVVAQAMWTPDVIKSIVAYLAANLHTGEKEGIGGNMTPTSTVSGATVDKSVSAERAELVLESLVTILQSSSAHLNRFTAALPAPRVLLLLLGEHPSPVVASNILVLLGILLQTSPSFSRKFELAHGWLVVKCVVPAAWDPSVHVAAFDILMGRTGSASSSSGGIQVSNQVIFPMILGALQRGLQTVSARDRDYQTSIAADSVMEVLVGEMLELYGSVPTFRLLFKHRATTAIFVELYRSFLGELAKARTETSRGEPSGGVVRTEDKLKVLAGLLCENSVVDAAQKQEVGWFPKFYMLKPSLRAPS